MRDLLLSSDIAFVERREQTVAAVLGSLQVLVDEVLRQIDGG
jgi:hypothetical protein